MPEAPWGPDEVVALHFDTVEVADEIAAWCGGTVERVATDAGEVLTSIDVPTPRGPRTALLGDWIAMRVPGEFQVFPPEDFAARHAPA